MKYIAPFIATTGALIGQPQGTHTRSDWHITYSLTAPEDQRIGYCSTGFLDAPDHLPTGSVRALDCTKLTVGIAYGRRP